ncbi:MAG: PilZ domain-containing protein [Gammaproteobacteria bacterium]|nr:PilZ domain-containing protein [Gammaproteobacteria bacterium]
MKNVEHRFSIRKTAAVNALINYDFAYSKRAKINNLSLSGALVKMDETPDLPTGARVETVLALGQGKEQIAYRLPANVVRVDGNTLALKFRSCDDRAYTALVNFLYATS